MWLTWRVSPAPQSGSPSWKTRSKTWKTAFAAKKGKDLQIMLHPQVYKQGPAKAMLRLSSLVRVKREKNSVLGSQRRLERKLKELNMTMEEEREAHTEQRDQVLLSPPAECQGLRLYRTQSNTPSAVAACSQSESSEETGGRGGDGAGKDRSPEEKGSKRH